MVFSKVEVNLKRLLEAAPRQQNHAKLVHYITTARELLEQLGAEITPEGISSVSKAKLSEYSEKIEALATTLAAPPPENENPVDENREEENSYEKEKVGNPLSLSSGLRRRSMAQVEVGPSGHERKERDTGAPIKLDAEAQAHIEKHRKLQEDLTDEMVDLARQLKESSMLMNQSVQNTEKILDSTESAVEHSLASTGPVIKATRVMAPASGGWPFVTRAHSNGCAGAIKPTCEKKQMDGRPGWWRGHPHPAWTRTWACGLSGAPSQTDQSGQIRGPECGPPLELQCTHRKSQQLENASACGHRHATNPIEPP